MEFYFNNRDLIKNLALNTGTTSVPEFSTMCTMTEVTLNSELEQQDFYVFCDAIQRSIITGVAMSIETTVKLDINNKAIQNLLAKMHTLVKDGAVAQFNNQLIQFELLSGVQEGVLEYTKYKVPCTLSFSELGGSAEDVSEFSLTIILTGKGGVVTQ